MGDDVAIWVENHIALSDGCKLVTNVPNKMLSAPKQAIHINPSIKRVSSHPRRFRRVLIQPLRNVAEAMNILGYGPSTIEIEIK